MIDLTVRCFNRARWLSLATTLNIIDATGKPNAGFAVDEIGAYEITAAIYTGTILTTPAVLDTFHMVNIRLYGSAFTADVDVLYAGETNTGINFTNSKVAAFVRNQASLVMWNGWRTYQFGLTVNIVALVDPRDFVYKRVWLGGMSI